MASAILGDLILGKFKNYKKTAQVIIFTALALALPAKANLDTNRKITDVYAKAYLQQKNPTKAVELLQDYLKEDPSGASTWSLLSKAHMQAGQSDSAISAMQNAVKYATNDEAPAFNYLLAEVQASSGKAEDAKKSLKLAAEEPTYKASVSKALKELSAGQSISQLKPTKSDNNWRGNVSVSTAYDDNVLLFSESLATSKLTPL